VASVLRCEMKVTPKKAIFGNCYVLKILYFYSTDPTVSCLAFG
jgi:hypothetical protein